jgi:hypothetical protein
MRFASEFAQRPQHIVRSGIRRGASVAWLGALMLALAGCATGGLVAPTVEQLSQTHYAPTQTVDVLSAPPSVPYASIARLHLSDPTGVASSSQLIAQLSDTAKGLGADALIVEQASHASGADVAFNPAGGQMQGSSTDRGATSVTALAIHYTH